MTRGGAVAVLLALLALAPSAHAEHGALRASIEGDGALVQAGEEARLELRLANAGFARVEGEVTLSSDDEVTARLLPRGHVSVAPGTTLVLALAVATRAATAEGVHVVEVHLHGERVAAARVVVAPPPARVHGGGLLVELADATATDRADDGGLGIRVSNAGSAASRVAVLVRDPTGRAPLAGADELALVVEPATSLVRALRLRAAAGATPGAYPVLVEVGASGAPGFPAALPALFIVAPGVGEEPRIETRVAPDALIVPWGQTRAAELVARNAGERAVTLDALPGEARDANGTARGYQVSWTNGTRVLLMPGESRALPLRVAAAVDAPNGTSLHARLPVRATSGAVAPQRVVAELPLALDPGSAGARPLPEPPRPPGPTPGVAIAAGIALGVGGAALAGALAARRETWRYVLVAPIAGLYTRLAASELLGHETRDELHRLVAQRPGIHLGELQRESGLHTGALVHHLRALERGQLLASRKDGPLRRFYPVGAAPPPAAGPGLTPVQQRVVDMLRDGPLTQRELAGRLGVSQQGANHHVKTLQRRGLVVLESDGRRTLVRLP